MNSTRTWTAATPVARSRATRGAPLLRAAAVGGCCAGALAGAWIGASSAPPATADAGLVLLLRGMAAIKALMLLGALAALLWRCGRPLSRSAAGCYLLALWTAAAAVALIAQPAFVAAAAVAFHIAEALFVATAWADGTRHGWWRGSRRD